jgi:legumain
MAYGDVVWDDENPQPGKLFNKQEGQDVWAGCNLDYSGPDVHAHNFMAILKGDESSLNLTEGSNSTSKVLKTNENTKLFLYFSDHGAPGHLIFPDTVIYAD